MLTVKAIHLEPERHGTALLCAVTFQLGDQPYNTVKVPLPPETTREIVDLIVKNATQALTVTGSEIAVAGEALPLTEPEVPEAPDFSEVEEAAPAVETDPVFEAPVSPLPEESF